MTEVVARLLVLVVLADLSVKCVDSDYLTDLSARHLSQRMILRRRVGETRVLS